MQYLHCKLYHIPVILPNQQCTYNIQFQNQNQESYPSKFSTTQFKSQQAFIYLNKNSYKIQYDINVTAEQSPKSQQKPTIIYVTAEQSKAKSNVLTKSASLPIMHLAR